MQLRQHTPSLSELISCLRRDLVLSFFRVKFIRDRQLLCCKRVEEVGMKGCKTCSSCHFRETAKIRHDQSYSEYLYCFCLFAESYETINEVHTFNLSHWLATLEHMLDLRHSRQTNLINTT